MKPGRVMIPDYSSPEYRERAKDVWFTIRIAGAIMAAVAVFAYLDMPAPTFVFAVMGLSVCSVAMVQNSLT